MIRSLTSLRGLFILFIFFHHCLDLYIGGGSLAVSFFFILGGFSMTIGYKERVLNNGFDYVDYFKKRCIKFYPLHWACLLAAIPLTLISFNWKLIPVFFINAGLLHTLLPINSLYFSFNSVSWYLADTVFFAAVFPLLIRFVEGVFKKGRFIWFLLIAFVYTVIVFVLPVDTYHSILYICPYIRVLDFLFGILLAYIFFIIKKNTSVVSFFSRNRFVVSLVLIIIIILLVIESSLLGRPTRMIAPVYWPFIALLILMSSLVNISGKVFFLENIIFNRLGELSFIIFMVHWLVLRYSSILFEKCHFYNNYLYVIFTLLVTIVLSIILERFFFKPITLWMTKRNQQSSTARL